MRTICNMSLCGNIAVIRKKLICMQQNSHLPVYISFSPNSICWCVFTTSNGKVMNAAICKLKLIGFAYILQASQDCWVKSAKDSLNKRLLW